MNDIIRAATQANSGRTSGFTTSFGRWRVLLCLAMALAGPAGAQSDEHRQRLIEQKLKLVETLVNSPAAKNASGDSAGLLHQGREALDQARRALAGGKLDDAAKLVDEALKSATAASRKLSTGGGALSDSAQRKNFQDLGEQVATYRASLVELSGDAKNGAAAKSLVARIDVMSAEARELAQGGRLGDANKKMADAYKLAVSEMSRLRAGQEVVLSLKFASPAEEYAYEQKRYGSNEIMLDMMIGEGRAEGGDKRRMIDGFVGEARKLKAQADMHAGAGKYKEAVAAMEQATAQLNRALQFMGVPVF